MHEYHSMSNIIQNDHCTEEDTKVQTDSILGPLQSNECFWRETVLPWVSLLKCLCSSNLTTFQSQPSWGRPFLTSQPHMLNLEPACTAAFWELLWVDPEASSRGNSPRTPERFKRALRVLRSMEPAPCHRPPPIVKKKPLLQHFPQLSL